MPIIRRVPATKEQAIIGQEDLKPTAPVEGGLYRHPERLGKWRIETIGRKWITLRSIEHVGHRGYWLTFREAHAMWPNGWTRA